MLAVTAFFLLSLQQDRTSAIYRFPANEENFRRIEELVDEHHYDTYCVEPKPGPKITAFAKGQVKFISPKEIDTKPNMVWRNATISFILGKISPKEWVTKTRNLKETVHFLSTLKTPELRGLLQNKSSYAVFAEMFLLSLPGRPCLTSGDTYITRELPDAGALQSWVLAMHDHLGPMLQYRHDSPFMVTGKPTVLRADDKPGLFIFRQTSGKRSLTFYFNNGPKGIELPPINMDTVTLNRGLDIEGPKPILLETGVLIEEKE